MKGETAWRVEQFLICSVQIDARFLPSVEIIRLSNSPEGFVHFRPVRPRKLSLLLSDVGRVRPEIICNEKKKPFFISLILIKSFKTTN